MVNRRSDRGYWGRIGPCLEGTGACVDADGIMYFSDGIPQHFRDAARRDLASGEPVSVRDLHHDSSFLNDVM